MNTFRLHKYCNFILKHLLSPMDYARRKGVIIGDNCLILGHPDWGSEPWLISLGNHVEVSSHVSFITHDGATWVFRDQDRYRNVKRYAKINVHNNCFIGYRSIILPGVTIGPNSIVGAGSVVTKDVKPGCVYAGVPASFICTIEEYAEKCLEQSMSFDPIMYKKNKREAVLQMLNNQ